MDEYISTRRAAGMGRAEVGLPALERVLTLPRLGCTAGSGRIPWPLAAVAGLIALASAACEPAPPAPPEPAAPATYEFGLIADLPYTAENEAMFPRLMADLNAAPLAFVVHLGDFTQTRCGDDLFADRLARFQASAHPFILVPGDNDWTDCHRASDGTYDPLERLDKVRAMFHSGDASLGQRQINLTRQSENPAYARYRENVRWALGPVLYVAINQPGSNNNLGRTAEMDGEHGERNAANLQWIREGFATAKREGYRGIMVIVHSNPGFEVAPALRSGYNEFLAVLEAETLAFPGPVALAHADTHFFRVDKPLVGSVSKRRVEHFTRVEAFGAPDSHWVRVTVDPEDPNLFRVSPAMVTENLVDHSAPDTGGFATRNGVFDPPRPR